MHEDDPSDLVHDQFAQAVFDSSPLARPILGTVESISSIARNPIAGYYRRRYRPENMVVSVAGNVEHATVVRLVSKAFAAAGMLDGDAAPAPPRTTGPDPSAAPRLRVLRRRTEQANVVLGAPGVSRTDERRFALGVLNAALGGGMSSRLFQEVREKRGLAYSVYSYHAQYADAGLFGVYAGCVPRKVHDVLGLCRQQLVDVAARGISADELERGKGQLRGSLVLGLEDTGARMSRIGKGELLHGEYLSVDAVLARIDAVTLDDVAAVGAKILSQPLTLSVVGPFGGRKEFLSTVA